MQHFIEFRFEQRNSLVVAAHMDVIMEAWGGVCD